MTVENTTNKQAAQVMGSATYDFTFRCLAKDPTETAAKEAIKCIVADSDGNETTLVYGTDYSVSLDADGIGGTVTVVNSRDSTYTITIMREYQLKQDIVLNDFDEFAAKTLEGSLDKLTMIEQQNQEQLTRSVKVGVTSSVDPDELVQQVERIYQSIDNVDTVADDIANVNIVAGDKANVDVVAGIASDVTTVSGIASDVSTVASNNANVSTVATNISDVNTVAGDIAKVTDVADDLTSIDAVNANKTNIDAVAADLTNIDAVAADLTNIDAVADDLTNIDAVKNNATNINAVAGNATNINAVNANKANIDAVAGNATNINAVNANKANIDTVAGNISDVNTVAGISTNVSTVAGMSSDVAAVVANETNINDVAADLTNINSVAGDLSNIDAASSYAASSKQWAVGEPTEPAEGSAKYWAGQASDGQLQSDWSQSDNTKKDFIKNKPTNLSQFTNDIDTLPSQAGNDDKFLKTDGTNASWAEIGGGMPIGSFISIPCTADYVPDGCLPCDGYEYSQSQFPTLWTNYLTSSPVKLQTCTYAEYASDITTYGQCGKFAIDTVNETFKVPTIKDGAVIQQALSNTELGKAYNAGLPNITGNVGVASTYGLMNNDAIPETNFNGAFKKGTARSKGVNGTAPVSTASDIGFDASLSNPIYGNSTTVQMNAITARYFVVVANAQINQSQMDWSAWATSLAGKANTEMDNITATGKETVVGWGMPDYDSTVSGVGNNYTAPCDGMYSFNIDNNISPTNESRPIYINNNLISFFNNYGSDGGEPIPISKGDTIVINSTSTTLLNSWFVPLKGAI